MVEFHLPPAATFLHRPLKTAILLTLGYLKAPSEPEVKEEVISAQDFSDSQLKDALEAFIKDLEGGVYGLRPLLRPDASRIKRSIL